ncbi:MAG: glycosyltransferase family 2 protein [Candidatus Gracilibacteria bacterium]
MTNKSTGIIVLTYNSEADIRNCISSILAQDTEISLIVIDNASQDNTLKIVKEFPDVELIESKQNLGFSWGVNTVAKIFYERGYENAVCINPDTTIDSSCISELLKTKEKSKAGIVQASVYLPDRTHVNSLGNAVHFTGISYCPEYGSTFRCSSDINIAAASGACMLMDLHCWNKLGGLKEDYFMYMEDTDLSWRMKLIDKPVMLSAKAYCYHDYSLSLPSWKLGYLDRNRIQMILANYSLRTLLLLLPVLIVCEIALLLWSIKKRYFLQKIHGYLHIVKRLPAIFRERSKIKDIRLLSDKDIFRMMEVELHVPGLKIPFQSLVNWLLRNYGRIISPFLK